MTGTINLGDEWEITADETVDDLVIRHKPTDNSFALGADGTFTPLPELAITSVDTVPDKAARLSVSAQEGDIVIQTDVSKTFVLTTNDPTVNSNWAEIQIDVLNTIDGQQITPSQVGTSSNRTDVVADTVDTNNLTGVSTGGVYQEDSNSPFQANGSDIDAQLSQSYEHVIGLIQADGTGVSLNSDLGMTVNGGGGAFHNYRQHDGTSLTDTNIKLGKVEAVAGRFTLTRRQRGRLAFSSQLGAGQNSGSFAEYGQVDATDVSSIQLFDRNNNSNDIGLQLRVFFA